MQQARFIGQDGDPESGHLSILEPAADSFFSFAPVLVLFDDIL